MVVAKEVAISKWCNIWWEQFWYTSSTAGPSKACQCKRYYQCICHTISFSATLVTVVTDVCHLLQTSWYLGTPRVVGIEPIPEESETLSAVVTGVMPFIMIMSTVVIGSVICSTRTRESCSSRKSFVLHGWLEARKDWSNHL